MAAHTKIDLYQMQSLPLDAKIRMTARRIDAFIDRNDAYLSIRDMKIAFMATGIERRSRAAMIEESEAGNEKTKTTDS